MTPERLWELDVSTRELEKVLGTTNQGRIIRELRDYVGELEGRGIADIVMDDRLSLLSVIESVLEDPQWKEAGRCHDWRNHIDSGTRKAWKDLPLLVRATLYIQAEAKASEEEWD